MSLQLLRITYTFNGARADLERAVGPVAKEIAKVPGLRWKIWLLNEAESSGGGIYLFDDERSVRAYLDGPIVAALRSHPAFSDVRVQTFDVLEGPSLETGGPIGAGARG